MSNFWTAPSGGTGILVDGSGLPILCANCPCGSDAVVVTCGDCLALPVNWLLTLGDDYIVAPSGGSYPCNDITDGDQCSPFNNASFLLIYDSPCVWLSAPFLKHCDGGFFGYTQWELAYDSILGSWTLRLLTSFFQVQFVSIPSASFNCLKANTFTRPGWDAVYGQDPFTATTIIGSNILTGVVYDLPGFQTAAVYDYITNYNGASFINHNFPQNTSIVSIDVGAGTITLSENCISTIGGDHYATFVPDACFSRSSATITPA